MQNSVCTTVLCLSRFHSHSRHLIEWRSVCGGRGGMGGTKPPAPGPASRNTYVGWKKRTETEVGIISLSGPLQILKPNVLTFIFNICKGISLLKLLLAIRNTHNGLTSSKKRTVSDDIDNILLSSPRFENQTVAPASPRRLLFEQSEGISPLKLLLAIRITA